MTCRFTSGNGGESLLKIFAAAALLLSVGVLAGCGSGEADEIETPAARQAIAFEGNLDPAYAGTWITADKTSTLVLAADGKANMTNVAVGRGTTKAKGEWKISGANLLFKVEGPEPYVSRYDAELKGDSLKLKQKSSKLNVEYKRSK